MQPDNSPMSEARRRVNVPLEEGTVALLRAGDMVSISGPVYAARDAAHARLAELAAAGATLPFDVRNQVIYYVGPTPPRPGRVIGSAGPTTASRMDGFTPTLIRLGLKGMIGKGARSKDVRDAIVQHRAVYFGAVEGTAALLAQHVRSAEVIAYPDLGPEAIRLLMVEEFPAIVVNDIYGGDLYQDARAYYRRD